MASCGDPRSRLDGEVEVELLHEELLIGIEFGVAAEDQRAPVRCGEVDIEHLDSSKFVEDGSRSETARERPQPRASRYSVWWRGGVRGRLAYILQRPIHS